MNEIDKATQLLCATKTTHKERLSAHVDQLVVQAMTKLTESIKSAGVGAEIVQIKLEEFQNEGDIVYIEFCNIMRQKLGPDLSIRWHGGLALKNDYATITLNISPFGV